MEVIQRIEELIINQLLYNNNYFRKVTPFLKPEYFNDNGEKILFEIIREFSKKYNKCPSRDTLSLMANERRGLSQNDIDLINEYVEKLLDTSVKDVDYDFLLSSTEKWCQERSMHNAILSSMSILNGDSKKDKNVIPELMRDALKISFDSNIGHDYDDAEERYNRLHERRDKIPFDIEALNTITNGGLENKTLNCVLAGTGVGKTALMCHFAANAISQGDDVLYITMEMAEEKIAERIDANLMDIPLDDFAKIDKQTFLGKFKNILNGGGFLRKIFGSKKKGFGKLIIKEYPTGMANVSHFRHLLDELNFKKNFKPRLIIIDYINICSSVRTNLSAGSYSFIKSIAEELRGLAVEYNVPIFTGTQTNRKGASSSDIEMEDTSESFGLPMTLDLYFAMMVNDTLDKAGRVAFKQLKNRYRDKMKNRYFSVGIERAKMRFFHVDDWNRDIEEESLIVADGIEDPLEERTNNVVDMTFEEKKNLLYKTDNKVDLSKFNGIKL